MANRNRLSVNRTKARKNFSVLQIEKIILFVALLQGSTVAEEDEILTW